MKKRAWLRKEELEFIASKVSALYRNMSLEDISRETGYNRWAVYAAIKRAPDKFPRKLYNVITKNGYMTLSELAKAVGAKADIIMQEVKPDDVRFKDMVYREDRIPEIVEKLWPVLDADKANDIRVKEMIMEKQKPWVRTSNLLRNLKGKISRQGFYNIAKKLNVKILNMRHRSWIRLSEVQNIINYLKEKEEKCYHGRARKNDDDDDNCKG